MNSGRRRSPGKRQTQILHPNSKGWTLIHHSKKPVSTAVRSTVHVLYTTLTEQRGWTWWAKNLWVAAQPWKPSGWASLRMVFNETTHPDVCWNSWRMCAFGWVRFFAISLNSTRRSLSLRFVGLPPLGIFRKSPLSFHFWIRYATVNYRYFWSPDMSLKDRTFLWYTVITPFSKFDNSVLRGILHLNDVNVVSDNIFNGGGRGVYQDLRNLHLHRCPNTYW